LGGRRWVIGGNKLKPIAHNPEPKLGIAFDIGTTTIVGSLLDIEGCKEIGSTSLPNPQARWGRDLLSRVQRVVENPSALKALQADIIRACNEIIHSLVHSSLFTVHAKTPSSIKGVVVVGNSVMEHLFLGVSPAPMAKAPYRPSFKESREMLASQIGLEIDPAGRVYTFPLIGGFIGGDTVGVILSTGVHKTKGVELAIDIGTNSEIVIGSKKGIYAASCAAGPAFEGGAIKDGMIADRGAIQGMKIEGDKVFLDVIGDVAPEGICGSGLIDVVAQLLKAGVIDISGRIKGRDEVASNLANRIEESPHPSLSPQGRGARGKGQGGNEFILYRDAKKEITLTQDDVRELQLAKGALQAGIRLLMEKARVKVKDIERVYIAGAFGSNIKKESLADIGVIEREWLDRVTFVGDGALEGAKMVVCSDEKREEAEDIARRTKHLMLSGSRHFQREFLKGMGFPVEC